MSAPRALPRVHRLLPRVFYGWFVAFGAAVLAFAAIGVGFYGQTVLLDGLVVERGWSLAAVAGASTLFFLTAGISGPAVGLVVDRIGPRGVILAGLALMALALLGIGRAQSPAALLPAYLALSIGFTMAGAIPSTALVTRWFIARRSLAMTVSQTGVSVGGVVLVPFAVYVIERAGVEAATQVLAVLLLVLGVPVTLWVLRSDPAPHGLETDGDAGAAHGSELLDPTRQYRRWGAREAVRTPAFAWLAVAFSCVLLGQVGLLIHALAFFREKLDAQQAAFLFSVLPGSSVVGRLVVGGLLVDRLDKRRVTIALFCVQSAGLATLGLASGSVALGVALVLFGLTIGNVFMMQSLLTGELFGIPSFGTVFGLLQVVTQIAAGLGPGVVGMLHVGLGGYAPTWLVLSALSAFAVVAIARVRPPA